MGITKGHVTGKPDYAKNFQDIADPDKLRKIMPDIFREKYQVRKIAPFACPVGCFRIYEVKEGPYAGTICNGFPANDIDNFGIKLGIDYPPAILKAHDLCSDLGLDEDSCSGVIAWAFECYERGILSKEFTGGLEFKWGDHRMILELLDKIANRQGLGDLLAEGCLHASEIIGKGSEEFCIHIKGQDNFEIMRGEKGWALGCVVSTRGGTHLRGAILTDRTDIPGFRNAPPQFLEKWHAVNP